MELYVLKYLRLLFDLISNIDIDIEDQRSQVSTTEYEENSSGTLLQMALIWELKAYIRHLLEHG